MIITFLCALPQVNYMMYLIHAAPKPSISLAYSVSILLVTSCLLLLFCFRCFTVTISVATITSISQLLLISHCKQCISGAVELTTQLSKLINILWLPLCRIYKLCYSYPRRLSRSLTVVGYQPLGDPRHPRSR